MEPSRVVIFDGVCNLCNGAVDYLIRRDRHERLMFTANQDAAGQDLLAAWPEAAAMDTMYLWENGELYDRSTAVLRIARHLPLPERLAYGFIVVPRPIRDALYKLIAANRYRWFGKKDTCRIPTPEERSRFLE